jgi:uncharacterized protein YggE
MLTVLAAIVAAPASAGQVQPQGPPSIVTRGEASVKRAPDQAWVSIAAESRASTSAEAQRLAAEAMKSVDSALSRAGLTEAAIKTTGYSLQPDMEYVNGRGRVRGYIARNQVEVRVDDLKKLSAVIDAAGAAGATSMAGLRFDIKDRDNVEREAVRLAVEDAMARAKSIASGAGASLGPILRIEEQRDSPPVQPMYRMATMSVAEVPAQTPISAGELEIRAQVTLTVGIR